MIDKMRQVANQAAEILVPTKRLNADLALHVEAIRMSVVEGRIDAFAPRVILESLSPTGNGYNLAVVGLGNFPQDSDGKREVMQKLGMVAAANDLMLVSATFESEAWTAEVPKDTRLEGITPPSEREDRKECIVAISTSIDGRTAMARIPITGRNEDKSLVLGPSEIITEASETSEGDVKTNLLSALFEAYGLAMNAKLEVAKLEASGSPVPEDLKQAVLSLDSCPIKMKP